MHLTDYCKKQYYCFYLQWGSRFCHPIDREPGPCSSAGRWTWTESHSAIQSLVWGKTGKSHINGSSAVGMKLISCFQVGGWTQVFGDVLSFATIRGASHEVPFSQPERSFVLFKAFVGGQPLPETFWSSLAREIGSAFACFLVCSNLQMWEISNFVRMMSKELVIVKYVQKNVSNYAAINFFF